MAVVTDDHQVRTIADRLGVQVTETIGFVVRAVEDGVRPAAAHELLRKLNTNRHHVIAALRSTAEEIIEGTTPEGPPPTTNTVGHRCVTARTAGPRAR